MDRDEEVLVRSQVSSASSFATCPLRRRVQRSWTALAFRRRETPNQVVSSWLVETCQMDVKKDKTAMDGIPEPVNKRAQPTANEVFQRKHVEARHVEKNGTQCFESGSQRRLGQQVFPRQIERDHQHRPEGKLSQSEAENFRDEDEANQSKIETVWFG